MLLAILVWRCAAQHGSSQKLTFEQLFLCLLDRSELQYDLDSDEEPYRAPSKSRFDEPDFVLVAGDTLRRLRMFRGTRVAFKRKGYQKDVAMIAKASSAILTVPFHHQRIIEGKE